MTIPADLWHELSPLLDEALDLAAPARADWLQSLEQCRPDLAVQLEALLAAHARSATMDPLVAPPTGLLAAALHHAGAALPPLAVGEMLGPYRLLSPLGEGGMGSVWLAEQTVNVVRKVALKIPHQGLENPQATAQRFARERDLLAGLEHPHIARLYDAGVSADGRPYLAMEWIDGMPVTQFADQHRLPSARRIELFLQVLRAVRYAHARLIIHRDLKPSNILVTPAGEVKLRDFGIAGLLDDTLAEGSGRAGAAERALTPEVASPEQLAGLPLSVNSDVYSLGIVLFELLTGQRPYQLKPAATGPAYHAALLETTVMPASRSATDPDAAARRSTTPGRLRAALAGDLDAILARALCKDPAERYESAEALAADLERALRFEPVRARAGGWTYVVGCALRRNRTVAGAAVLVLIAVLGGGVGVLWQARIAQQQAERATAVKNFLTRVFKASDPRVASDRPRGQVTARELLDIGAARIPREFAAQPAVQIELFGLLTEIYHELNETQRYEQTQARRLALAHQYPGQFKQAEVEEQLNRIGDAIWARDFALARERLDKTDASIREAGLDQSSQRALWWYFVAEAAERAQLDTRQQAYEKSVALYEQVAPRDAGRMASLNELGVVRWERGDIEGAIQAYVGARKAHQVSDEPDDAELTEVLANLAMATAAVGRMDESMQYFEQTEALARQTYGEEHLNYWGPAANHARLLHNSGQRDEALARFQALFKRVPFPPPGGQGASLQGWNVYQNYANCLLAQGEAEAARPYAEAIVAKYEHDPLDEHALRAARLQLGNIYAALGRSKDARRLRKLALDEFEAKEPPERKSRLVAVEAWGRQLLSEGDLSAARAQFEQVLAQDKARHLPVTALAQADLATVALAQHQDAAALTSSTAAMAAWAATKGMRDVRDGVFIARTHARALLANGRNAEARDLAVEALASSQRYDVAGAPSIKEARTLLELASRQ